MRFSSSLIPIGVLLLAAAVFPPLGCGDSGDEPFGTAAEPEPVDPSELCNEPGASQCDGLDYEVCVEGRWFRQETCDSPTPYCDPDGGCTECIPEVRFCVARDVYECSGDGTSAALVDTCGTGEECILGQCYNACSIAEQTNSYLGCRFLAVATANLLGPAFGDDFAVVVTNPSEEDPADIVVRQGAGNVATTSVQPGETQAIRLPFPSQLQGYDQSHVVADGAYEVTSSLPIAAYQYNPLHFQLEDSGGAIEHSYTNDASLLLPEHVLTGSYLASTWPTFALGEFPGESQWSPGFIAIAATADGTSIEFTSTANTQGGTPPALEPGGSSTVTLDRGDVLQIFAETPVFSLQTNTCLARGGDQASNGDSQSCLDRQLGDLTGSRIEASQPVAVFAGHVCTFMPFDRFACDHLEEMMFPLQTWGRQAVMTAPQSPNEVTVAPALYRVLSRDENNFVSFSPEVHAPVELDVGEFVEFLSGEDFLVDAIAPIYVTQALLGEQSLGTQSGDPALGSGIPVAQWRNEYDFLVPETYSSNWLNLVAASGTEVYLDGRLVEGWEPMDGPDYQVARIEVEPGSHHIESAFGASFGITAYGYASYTSYLLPGGMNFLR